jgi:hypothetical protein
VEQGTHDELVVKVDGVYQSMWNAQSQKDGANDSKSDGGATRVLAAAATDKITATTIAITATATAATEKKTKEQKAGKVGEEKKDDKDEVVKMAPNVSIGRVLSLTKSSWPWLLVGLCGSIFDGAIFPFLAWVEGDISNAYYLTDENQRKSQSATNAVYFLLIGVGLFFTNILQTGCLGVVGERLTYTVREMSFNAMLRKEVCCYHALASSL